MGRALPRRRATVTMVALAGAALVLTAILLGWRPWAHPTPPRPSLRAGVPVGWHPLRTVRGDLVVRDSGAVVEDTRVLGRVLVEAPHVTLRRVEVVGGGIDDLPGSTCANGLVVEHSTIRRAPGQHTSGDYPALNGGGYTARWVRIAGLPEGFRVGGRSLGCGPVAVTHSVARVVAPDACSDDWHGDALQGYDGPSLTVRDTRLQLVDRPGCGGTAPFFYPAGQGNTTVRIDGLLVQGGGFPFRLGTPGAVHGLRIVAGSWGYGPFAVDCPMLSSWRASIVRLGPSGQVRTVRRLPCTTSGG